MWFQRNVCLDMALAWRCSVMLGLVDHPLLFDPSCAHVPLVLYQLGTWAPWSLILLSRWHSWCPGVPISLLLDLPMSWVHLCYPKLPRVHRVHCNTNAMHSWQHYPAFHSEISWFQHQISKTKPICMEILRTVHAYSKGVLICWLHCRCHREDQNHNFLT